MMGGVGVLVGVEVGVGVGGTGQTPGSVPTGLKSKPQRHVLSISA
ncbi:MAG: hypothetical protein HW404_1292 [Anaerolineales bacterium]|nr:hypothetical protein [Anaerolineales bacterium]